MTTLEDDFKKTLISVQKNVLNKMKMKMIIAQKES